MRGWDRAKCARVWRAGAEIIGAEKTAWLREDMGYKSEARPHSMIEGTASLCECTIPQAWASAMLNAVQAHLTRYTVIEGSESSQTITDNRPAAATLRRLIAA